MSGENSVSGVAGATNGVQSAVTPQQNDQRTLAFQLVSRIQRGMESVFRAFGGIATSLFSCFCVSSTSAQQRAPEHEIDWSDVSFYERSHEGMSALPEPDLWALEQERASEFTKSESAPLEPVKTNREEQNDKEIEVLQVSSAKALSSIKNRLVEVKELPFEQRIESYNSLSACVEDSRTATEAVMVKLLDLDCVRPCDGKWSNSVGALIKSFQAECNKLRNTIEVYRQEAIS